MNAPVTPEQILAQRNGGPGASQATSIEQSRAVAEVQAAFTIAQRCPRDETIALSKAIESCRTWAVAEKAFFKFPRGGESVSGETIHMAAELARCWGNINYGIMELDRDEVRGMSEMLAFAIDLEANTQIRTTFLVPHKRDTRQGTKALVDMRDIYENNANNGARRLRECIFRVLPESLKTAAKDAARETLEKGRGDKPLKVRVAEAIELFDKLGISRARLEQKLGRADNWTAVDVANLGVAYNSIKRQEISAEEEFPRNGVEETTKAAKALVDKSQGNEGTLTAENPTAAEGPDDSQRGEAHSDDDPRQKVADDIISAFEAVTSAQALADLMALRANDIAALPEEMAADVKIAERDAKERISETAKRA